MKPDGPVHPADGTLGRPRCLADGGGHKHDVHGYTRTRLKVNGIMMIIFEVDNDNIVPGFTTKVLSVGMLRKQGFKMSLDTEPYGFYTPEEEWVAVNEHDNLLYIDAEHATAKGQRHGNPDMYPPSLAVSILKPDSRYKPTAP